MIHVSAAGGHTDLPLLFAGFLAVAVLQIALGALLLWSTPSRWLVAGGIVLMLGAIGAWVLSRTEGLPFVEGGHIEPVGFKDGVTVLFEAASIPALLLLLSRDLERVTLPSPRLETQTLTALGLCCFALMVPALMLEGGSPRSHEQAVALGLDGNDHSGGRERAQAGPRSHERTSGAGDHPAKTAEKKTNKRGHEQSDVELASTPVGTSHGQGGGAGATDPTPHRAGDDDSGEGNHGGGKNRRGGHRRGRPDRDRGHGGGDHGKEEPAGEPADEPPISVSYGPEPSVCVGAVCVP